MQLSSVAFVLVEAILRELNAKVTHHPIARYLCDHAGGGDAETDAISVDDGSLRKWKRNDGQPIDQNVIGRIDKCRNRHSHRSMACTQNIDAINLNGIDNTDCPSDFGIGHQIRINFLPQLWRKLLGIVQATMTKFFGKDHGSSDNRTRQRTTTGFVNPGNPRNTGAAQFFLVTKSASPVHVRDLMTRRFNDLSN
jgi:microcompartment protein CcmK/EutM